MILDDGLGLLKAPTNKNIVTVVRAIDPILDQIYEANRETIYDVISQRIYPFRDPKFDFYNPHYSPETAPQRLFRQWLEVTATGLYRRVIPGVQPAYQHWVVPCGWFEATCTKEAILQQIIQLPASERHARQQLFKRLDGQDVWSKREPATEVRVKGHITFDADYKFTPWIDF